MNNQTILVSTLLMSLSFVGCSSTPKVDAKAASAVQLIKPASDGYANAHHIYVCRPSSLVRGMEKPDLKVDGAVVSEVANGTQQKLALSGGKTFEIFLPASTFMYRFNDEVIYSTKTEQSKSSYLLVSAQINWAQSATIYFEGALGEMIRQGDQSKSDNWKVAVVDKTSYEKVCADAQLVMN